MRRWLTADFHFDHTNIIKYCHRPFKTVDEMNETMISNWNTLVKPGDEGYILGDFIPFCKKLEHYDHFTRRLNGNLFFIMGSHDDRHHYNKLTKCFSWVRDLSYIKDMGPNGTVLCHWAMMTWHKSFHGSYHAFGHSHGRLVTGDTYLSHDVGVDCNDFRPVSEERFVEIMSKKKFIERG
jgi:calcineurin-like phosphoesterase family protein